MMDFNDEVFNGLLHGKDFTSDIKEMEEALTYIESRGGTAMRDAIRASIDHMEQRAHNDRKVIVLLTEGNDTSSTVTQEQLLGKLKNSSIRIYSIGLPGEDDAGRFALRQLVQASGGRDYYPKDLAQVESISSEIANEMRMR
jgi:Mg-chelatase subunit ChlD